MDPATLAIIAVVVSAVSEILPFTPLKGNGIAQIILEVLLKVFPGKETKSEQ
jgi:hypothetical protein